MSRSVEPQATPGLAFHGIMPARTKTKKVTSQSLYTLKIIKINTTASGERLRTYTLCCFDKLMKFYMFSIMFSYKALWRHLVADFSLVFNENSTDIHVILE